MTQIAFYQGPMLIHGKALGAKGDGLVQAHMFPDDGGFADDHTRAMVYEEEPADLCTGMDFDAGGRMSNFRNHSRDQWRAQPVQLMGQPVIGNGGNSRIAYQNLIHASCS